MNSVSVPASRPYEVTIGRGLLARAGEITRPLIPGGACAVLTDDTVDSLYGDAFLQSLRAAGLRAHKFVFAHGEENKTLDTVARFLSFLCECEITRADAVIALGGGISSDMAGFASAVYLRGVRFIPWPTTLLSAVDASVGGKTAVNLPEGKNLAGAFHQPSGVFMDTGTLSTLPPPLLADGLAEAVKTGLLADRALFGALQNGAPADLTDVITRCVEIKRDFVVADELDVGERQKLNLGHTFGHAIEKCSNFSVSHGRAVAIGLVMAARTAEALGVSREDVLSPLQKTLAACGLATTTDLSAHALLNAMLLDKKRAGDTLQLVLPVTIGACTLYPTPVSALPRILEAAQ